jgi:hypothetical protein
MPRPETARGAHRGSDGASYLGAPKAAGLNSHVKPDSAAQRNVRELAIYDGRDFVGTLLVLGRCEFRAIAANGAMVGDFATQRDAVRAAIAAAAGG